MLSPRPSRGNKHVDAAAIMWLFGAFDHQDEQNQVVVGLCSDSEASKNVATKECEALEALTFEPKVK